MVNFAISFVILIGLMAWYHIIPTANVLFLPLFFLLAAVTALGAGSWLAAMNVHYRDVKYVVPFIVRMGLYISPVGFLSSIVPEKYKLVYSLNPMVGVIDGFRWAILGGDYRIYWPGFFLSLFLVALLLVTGVRYFRSTEKKFADVI